MLGKCLTACLVVSASAWAQTAPPHGPDSNTLETLADYRAAAQAHNRGVQAARLEWEAALQRVPQVSALPNPVLSYGHFIEPVETRVGPQKRRLGLKQSLPWFGTLGLKGDVAEAEARAARARYQSARLALDRDVIAAYADLFYLNAAIDVTESNILLLSKWEDVLRTRYSTGSVNYSDLIKVQVELGILQDALAGRRDQHQAAEARLAALLNLPPHTDFSRPTALPEPEAPAPLDTFDEIVDIDIAFTPAALLLPVRRLSLTVGESGEATAVTIRPDLALEAVPRRFTRLAENRYRMESGPDFDIERTFTTDDFGLVRRVTDRLAIAPGGRTIKQLD